MTVRIIARRVSVLLFTILMLSAAAGGTSSARRSAPVLGVGAPGSIKNQYIVVFRDGTSASTVRGARDHARSRGGSIRHEYGSALKGFAATLTPGALAALRDNPSVAYVEADRVVRAADTQTGATWGLDRIDQRSLPLTSTYSYDATGSGVKAYIIDTGIRASHSQFAGRVGAGYDAVGGGTNDCNGHGTHVAGTVGGTTYGVAKQVALVPVRVLGCTGSGSTSGVIAGVNWVTSNHVPGQPAVANMSLGGGISTSLDNAVISSINDGVMYAIAAGNSNANACNYSPARVSAALTVGATTSSDARASYSNYGTCLDVFGPGSSITSAWYSSDTATSTISGTSMATPHVAGVAALYLQANPTSSPATVAAAITGGATTNTVTSAGSGSPNRLLYSLLSGTPAPDPTPTPTPEPVSDACDLAQTYSGTLSGAGDYDYQPNGTYYRSSKRGTHRGCLRGPDDADFDLYLYKRTSRGTWTLVAKSIGTTADEDVVYFGSSGLYLWRVYSYSGSGSYEFELTRP